MEHTTSGQSFAFELKGNSAIILRCFSHASKAVIPEQINGHPVTEIAPYAFSAHMNEKELAEKIEKGQAFLALSSLETEETKLDELTALCGVKLTDISFPLGLVRVGRYCFYNCDNLTSLEFSESLADWGSGVFTGCHHVNKLRVHQLPNERSYLKNVLDELVEEMEITYLVQKPEIGPDGQPLPYDRARSVVTSQVLFPEFFEEGLENTPARLLSQRIHGSGAMYRNCFHDRKLDLRQYDTVFPNAKPIEAFRILGKLSILRLRYPNELSETARNQYFTYLAEHEEELIEWLLTEEEADLLKWFVEYRKTNNASDQERFLQILIEKASRKENPELMGYLMSERRKSSGEETKKGVRRKRLEF